VFLIGSFLGDPPFLSCCSKSFWIVLNTTVALPKPGNPGQDFVRATTCCIVLQRLLASRPCFEAIRTMPDVVAVIFQVKKKIVSVPHSGNPSSVKLKSRIHLCLQQTGWWFASQGLYIYSIVHACAHLWEHLLCLRSSFIIKFVQPLLMWTLNPIMRCPDLYIF